jgi:hypothetical protein
MAREVGKNSFKKAKSARSVDISNTSWKKDTGAGPKGKAGRLVGPKGKLYTGSVKMSDGSTAVYKDGKRVTKGAAPASKSSTKKSTTPARPAPKKNDKPKPERNKTSSAGPMRGGGSGSRPKPSAGPKLGGGSGVKKTSTSAPNKRTQNPYATKPRPQGKNLTPEDLLLEKARREGPQGPLANVVRNAVTALVNRGAPKPGDTRISGGGRYKQVYRNGKWVTTHKKNSSGRWVKNT